MDNPYVLSDACDIVTGKLDANAAEKRGKFPFFTCSAEPSFINTFAFDTSAILLAGNNAQGNFHVARYNGKFNAYQRTYVLTEKNGFDLDYVFYGLKLSLRQLKKSSQGSQTKFLTMSTLETLPIGTHLPDEQQKAVELLVALDAKIELNNRINAELEALAKTIYDYWFVQFDFPDKNGKPYKTSGGKMVYNEGLKREIPAGWESAQLGDKIAIKRGISYRSADITDVGANLINLNSFNLNGSCKFSGTKNYSGKFRESQLISPGELVTAITDVTRNADIIGKAFIVPENFEGNTLISCDVAAICGGDDLPPEYLECVFNSQPYHDYIKHFASGTLVLHLDLNGLKWFEILVPDKNILSRFCEMRSAQRSMIARNQVENQHLTQLRDWLLPMLMNGQVTVK